ncbi:hypothetical protein M2371_004303 [Buttiauxella sp. BIGb0471]|uniref:hypothetical protein n=1 Tax=Buttiauxella sp. BIGb0471 TaxID=2940597 RepID=UPI00216752F4|nr:hypothetical protein [Buttiauxella sp. BIGb0471]MCS3605049.1 hypothetical protein [Buttiauxella sp. BIGb0471]
MAKAKGENAFTNQRGIRFTEQQFAALEAEAKRRGDLIGVEVTVADVVRALVNEHLIKNG